MSYDIHPDVQAALDAARDLRNRIADLRERIDAIKARRPSPSGLVVPEVDAMGRLKALYLAPGTAARFDNAALAAEIMAAIRESTADAARQYRTLMDADPWADEASGAETDAAREPGASSEPAPVS